MIQIIKNLLQQLIDDIDSGNSNINDIQQKEIIDYLSNLNRTELSKIESANYLGVSRATFDNYVKKGLIPSGTKRQGFRELSWNKHDLDSYVKCIQQ